MDGLVLGALGQGGDGGGVVPHDGSYSLSIWWMMLICTQHSRLASVSSPVMMSFIREGERNMALLQEGLLVEGRLGVQ